MILKANHTLKMLAIHYYLNINTKINCLFSTRISTKLVTNICKASPHWHTLPPC